MRLEVAQWMAAQTPIPRLSHQSNQMRPKSFLVSCLVILDRLFDLFDRSFPSGSEGIERPYPLVLEVSSSGEKGLETVEFGLVDFASGCSVVETRLVTLFIVFFFSFCRIRETDGFVYTTYAAVSCCCLWASSIFFCSLLRRCLCLRSISFSRLALSVVD